jgi:phospholipid/cholesterol/gamma-HCH transport system substrate-binding protein
MEREANYAAVGAFVLLVTLIAALFVYWYSDTREHRSYNRYEIYFDGSVSGLERGGAVRYLGVGVGRVVDLRVDPRDPSRVEVIVDIDSTTPISQKTLAQLQLQGVTGLLYIDLLQSHGEEHPALIQGLKYPVIRSGPSRFDTFLASLPEVMVAAAEVVNRANRLLSDENLRAVSVSLDNVQKAASGLPQTMREANALIADLRVATAQLTVSARSAGTMIGTVGPELQGTVERFRTVADNLTRATDQLDQAITENRSDMRSFIHNGLPEIERFLREGRDAAQQIKELSASLRQNPSQLIYQPVRQGVEIPR